MNELLREKSLWAASALCFAVLVIGFPYDQIKLPLQTGAFLKLYQEALGTQMVLFCIPIVSVLPVGAVFVKESAGGFLKLYIHRISRAEYIRRKTMQVYVGGILPFFFAGILGALVCFLGLYPLELKGELAAADLWKAALLLLRICLIGGITAEVSGIFAALSRNYYMAYGLPFVCYYLLVILKERYLPEMYAMYPGEWIAVEQGWGADGSGIWWLLAAGSLAMGLLHELALYVRLKEI